MFSLAFLFPIYTGQYLYLALILLSVPFNFGIVFWTSRTLRENARYLPILVVLMCATMAVEHATMWKALYKYLTGGSVAWTKWERQGVDGVPGVAPPVPPISIPNAIVRALTVDIPSVADLEASLDLEIETLVASDSPLALA